MPVVLPTPLQFGDVPLNCQVIHQMRDTVFHHLTKIWKRVSFFNFFFI